MTVSSSLILSAIVLFINSVTTGISDRFGAEQDVHKARDFYCRSSIDSDSANYSCKARAFQSITDLNESLYDIDGSWRFRYIEEEADKFVVLVQEATIDQRLSNVLYTASSVRLAESDHHKFASGDPIQDEANQQMVATPELVDNELCARHLGDMSSQMEELSGRLDRKRADPRRALNLTERHYRLARVLDAFGRYDSGHLAGKSHAPGAYDQCVTSQLLLSAPTPPQDQSIKDDTSRRQLVGTRYCWAKFNLDKHLHPSLRDRAHHPLDPKDRHFLAAICIPETCHSTSFKKHPQLFEEIASSQFRLPTGIYLDESLELDSIYCLLDKTSLFESLPASGRLWFGFVSIWTVVAIYATISNGVANNGLLKCLDLRQSWADFTESNAEKHKIQRKSRLNFDALNPVKAIGALYIVVGHSTIYEMGIAADTLRSYNYIDNDPICLLILFGVVLVDSFTVITGMILAYSVISRESRQITSLNKQHSGWALFFKKWALIAVTRYLRLLPLFYLVFWFQKGVMIHLNGHLPYWDTGFNQDTVMGACKQETWLSPLIILSAYLPMTRQCLSQTWTISADLFFVLTLTPLVLLFARRPKLATIISILLCLFSVIWSYRAFNQLEDAVRVPLKQAKTHGFVKLLSHVSYIHTSPHTRFSSISIGFIFGYHLFRYNNHGDKLQDWPRWLKGFATYNSLSSILIGLILWPQFGLVKRLLHPYYMLVIPHLFSTVRLLWSLTNAILFMRMVSDWKDTHWIGQVSLHKFWRILVRLSYSILLIHMTMLRYDISIQTSMGDFSRYRAITRAISVYCLCLPIGALLHVLFENPINKMAKRIVAHWAVMEENKARNIKAD